MYEMIAVSLILFAALYFFVSERFSVDVTALIILSLLICFGLITAEESISGFGNQATITIAAMFVISASLKQTGVVNLIGNKITKFANSPSRFTLVISALVGSISAFINNTATVAVFLPTVLSVCKQKKLSPSRYLIPLSYASQFGGVCTLIGTSTNLLVSALAVNRGLTPFSIFEFAQLGLIMFVVGVLYFLLFGKYVLPDHSSSELVESYGLGKYLTELEVTAESPLIGKTLVEADLGKEFGLNVFEIYQNKFPVRRLAQHKIELGDTLLAGADLEQLVTIQQTLKLSGISDQDFAAGQIESSDLALIETIIAPGSNLLNKSLREINFKQRFNAIVVAIRRRNQVLRSQLRTVKMKIGDELLLLVPKSELNYLQESNNLILINDKSDLNPNFNKLSIAVGIVALVIGLAVSGILPILQSSIVGCLLMVLAKCISIEDAYQAIDWKVIVMLGGVLPLGLALENSGLIDLLVSTVFETINTTNPVIYLALIYLLTAVLTEIISNNAAAVLLAPIAISTATMLGVSPYPFLVAVCFAASTSFATPVGYQTNTMVYSPGNYTFKDFLKAGVPLNIIFWILAVIFIPIFWKF